MKTRSNSKYSWFVSAALLSGCTTFFDTTVLGSDALEAEDASETDDGADGSDADASDTDVDAEADAADTDTADTAEIIDANGCGGFGELLLDGEPAALGDSCGCGGTVVCNGIDRLRCAESLPENVCGGCGLLEAAPGDSCGRCGDGSFLCSDGKLACSGDSPGNLCGGCSTLDEALRAPCDDEGAEGRYRCAGEDLIVCETNPNVNECGGTGPLMLNAQAVQAGGPCDASCGAGIVVCDRFGGATCVAPAPNACGGCEPLLGALGSPCGCGDAIWVCDGESQNVVCSDGAPNDCGGCGELSPVGQSPGDLCNDGGARVCTSPETTACSENSENACGGTVSLESLPGADCGACNSGEFRCLGLDSVRCEGDLGQAAFNACGGCAVLEAPIGSPCGTCGSGTFQCAGDDELSCSDDRGDAALNACGGCQTLGSVPGDSCGECATWECSAQALLCQPNPSLPGCSAFETTCATLNCSAVFRNCDERAEDENAICTDCSAGYRADGDICVAADCDTDEDCPPIAGAFGACDWAETCDESADQTRLVTPRTCADGVCAEGPPFEETAACAPRDTDGDLCEVGNCAGGFCVPAEVAPAVPTGLSATDGTVSASVDIRFTRSTGATSYKLLRDGVEIGQPTTVCAGSTTELCYADTGAPAPSAPAAPTGAAASNGRAGDIRITWTGSTISAGSTATYTVVAVGGTGLESEASAADTGFRAASPVLRYEVDVAGVWTDAGLATQYDDATAPPGTLNGGTVTVTPTASGNALNVSDLTTGAGPSRSYRVRAVSAAGTSAASSDATGRRAAGEISQYAWSRSQTNSGFAAVPGAAAAANATDANSDAQCTGSSWNYQVEVSSTAGGSRTVASTGGPYCYWTVLNAPALSSPADASTGVSLTHTFDWADVAGATDYRIFVTPSSTELATISSTSTTCATCVVNDTTSESQFEVPSGVLTRSTAYYWMVRATGGGAGSPNSSVWSFQTSSGLTPAYGACTGVGADATCETGYCGNRRCTTPNFHYIPASSDVLGAPTTESGTQADEQPQHTVTLSAFEMMRLEVTQAQWFAVAGQNPSYFQTSSCTNGTCASTENLNGSAPVERVDFYSVLAYANARSRADGLDECYTLLPSTCADATSDWRDGVTACTDATLRFSATGCNGYRLPTEAEWEFAARAGTDSATYSVNNSGELAGDPDACVSEPALDDIAWYCSNGSNRTHIGGGKASNAFGLSDMLGNVWEWTWDWFGPYSSASLTDPLGAAPSTYRCIRGGSWSNFGGFMRTANRSNFLPSGRDTNVGFRLVRSVP